MNLIILTTGISGSSVITGLFAKSGLWTGDETIFKDNITGTYETHENKKLVELNESLFEEARLEYDAKTIYEQQTRNKFNDLYKTIDICKYQDFLRECDLHSPWIWKDPQLFVTIGFWMNLLELTNTKIIVLHRNIYELWKSQTIKRIIYSYRYLRNSENKTRQELLDYLDSNGISFISIEYDQFTKHPDQFIDQLNEFIGSNLNQKNWDEIYRKTSRFSNFKRTLLAFLIYLKNYKNRIK